jgi:hypothetical protein
MDRAHLHTGRVLTVLTLHRHINEPFLRNLVRLIVMFRVFEIDQVPSFESNDPDPVKLRMTAGVIVLFRTGIDASPAADATGKFKAISPEGIRQGILGTDLKLFSVFLQISFFQFGDQTFLFFTGHLPEVLL